MCGNLAEELLPAPKILDENRDLGSEPDLILGHPYGKMLGRQERKWKINSRSG
jgi:hypothetical protein